MTNNINRIKWIHVRLSPSEHKLVLKRKANSTSRNLSEYLRNLIFERPIVTTYRNRSQDDLIQQMAVLNRELNGIGNNLNQIAMRLHTLRAHESYTWAAQFSSQIENVLSRIAEVKELTRKMAEQWLR